MKWVACTLPGSPSPPALPDDRVVTTAELAGVGTSEDEISKEISALAEI